MRSIELRLRVHTVLIAVMDRSYGRGETGAVMGGVSCGCGALRTTLAGNELIAKGSAAHVDLVADSKL